MRHNDNPHKTLVDKYYLFDVITWLTPKTIEMKTTYGGFPFKTLQFDKEENKRAKKYFRRCEVDAYVSDHKQKMANIING